MSHPILLFAAGFGTRMGRLSKDLPKPLIPVAGQTLLEHALAQTRSPHISRRVVNLHYKGDMIRDHLAGQDIAFSDESDALLETGGGLRKALPLLDADPVLTLNTDAVWRGPNAVDTLVEDWSPSAEVMLLLVPRDHAFGHQGKGDFCMDASGRLTRGTDYIYTGLQMLRTKALGQIKDTVFSMNVLWDQADQRGTLFGAAYPGDWCDVGRPDSIAIAEDMLMREPHV